MRMVRVSVGFSSVVGLYKSISPLPRAASGHLHVTVKMSFNQKGYTGSYEKKC